MRWIENIMPPKFYRFMYHKMVILAMKFGNREPHSSSVILMAMTTINQLYFIILGFGVLIGVNIGYIILPILSNIIYLIIFLSIYGYIHYPLFYYKGKYKKIMEEFKEETPKQTKVGIIYVLIYVFTTLLVLLYISGWFLTFNNPHYS